MPVFFLNHFRAGKTRGGLFNGDFMPSMKRIRTRYPGVYYIVGQSITGESERIYYIRYRRGKKEVEEKAGREFLNGMTPEKAVEIRAECLKGNMLPRKERLIQEERFRYRHPEKEDGREGMFEEKWHLFMQSATEGFALLDSNLNMVELNDMVLKIFPDGTEREEILGENILDLFPHIIESGEYENYVQVVETGKPFVLEDIIAQERFGKNIHFNFRGFKVGEGVGVIITDISDSKRKEKELQKREEELQLKARELEETNTALKVLLKRREKDRAEVEENMVLNVKELVQPYLNKIKNRSLSHEEMSSYVKILESNLNNIISPFVHAVSFGSLKFTHAETQMADFIRHGKTTKEIADLLMLSVDTIKSYRKRIRKKLGINRQKVNLRTYLSSIK